MESLNDLPFEEAIEIVHDRDPRQFPWGYYSWSDAPPPFGGGVGAILWFTDRDEMFSWLGKCELDSMWLSRLSDEDRLACSDDAREILERMRSGGVSDPDGMRELNEILSGIVQYTWFGTFDDLTSGTGEFSLQARRDFHLEQSSDSEEIPQGGTEHIQTSELDDFVEFVQQYGI